MAQKKTDKTREIVSLSGLVTLLLVLIVPLFTLPGDQIVDELTSGALVGFAILALPFILFWLVTKNSKNMQHVRILGALMLLPLLLSIMTIASSNGDGQSGFIFIYAFAFQLLAVTIFALLRTDKKPSTRKNTKNSSRS